jgi:hypothetical protein
VHLVHAVQHFDIAHVEVGTGADRAQHGVALTGGAMNLKPHAHQMIDHLLDLITARAFLHGHNHR